MQHIAIYMRVSSKRQDTRSQEPDLRRWVEAFAGDMPVEWYTDAASGTSADRPDWKRLEADIATGAVSKLVVWRLDRLGRSAGHLVSLFEELQRKKIGFESVRDRIDLDTASGRMMACVLSAVAQYENEIRSERIRAGQAAARAAGKRWGGSKKGRRLKVTDEQVAVVHRMASEGASKAAIARAVSLSRPTVYEILSRPVSPS